MSPSRQGRNSATWLLQRRQNTILVGCSVREGASEGGEDLRGRSQQNSPAPPGFLTDKNMGTRKSRCNAKGQVLYRKAQRFEGNNYSDTPIARTTVTSAQRAILPSTIAKNTFKASCRPRLDLMMPRS